ncbi:hypothetical protein PYCC9005_003208 [Savitreella phatthalungensis]
MSPLKEALVAQILSYFDASEGQITEGAVRASRALLDTFVREAVLRAQANKRDESLPDTADDHAGATIMLETDDLEKVLGQMIVDFS